MMTKRQFLMKSRRVLSKDYFIVKAKSNSVIIEKDTKPGKFLKIYLTMISPIVAIGFLLLHYITNDKLMAAYLSLVGKSEPNIFGEILVAIVIMTVWISFVYLIAYLFVPSEVKDIELT